MSGTIDFPPDTKAPGVSRHAYGLADVERVATQLETDGIALLPALLTADQLKGMKQASLEQFRRLSEDRTLPAYGRRCAPAGSGVH